MQIFRTYPNCWYFFKIYANCTWYEFFKLYLNCVGHIFLSLSSSSLVVTIVQTESGDARVSEIPALCLLLSSRNLTTFKLKFLITHSMTTSRNLFQSAGLYLLSYIARPFISLMSRRSSSISLLILLSYDVSGTSIRHFSIKLYNS